MNHPILLIVAFFICLAGDCFARAVRSPDLKTLLKSSKLVMVGKVTSVTPSGITTRLTYPTWNDVTFEWLKVEIKVIEPIKGSRKGEIVRTLMLSTRGRGPMFNPPGMVNPKVGQYHLLCLLPTTFKGVYASLTAPFDDDQAIFLLDRSSWTDGSTYYKDGKEVAFYAQNDKQHALWSLVDDQGSIQATGAKAIRKKYQAEIATPAPESSIIHLQWKKETSESGWQWNVPNNDPSSSGETKPSPPSPGPVTKPLSKD